MTFGELNALVDGVTGAADSNNSAQRAPVPELIEVSDDEGESKGESNNTETIASSLMPYAQEDMVEVRN